MKKSDRFGVFHHFGRIMPFKVHFSAFFYHFLVRWLKKSFFEKIKQKIAVLGEFMGFSYSFWSIYCLFVGFSAVFWPFLQSYGSR